MKNKSFSGISLTGTIETLTDLESKRTMWYDGLASHFTGPEDKGLCVLLFNPERYNIFIDYQKIYGEIES